MLLDIFQDRCLKVLGIIEEAFHRLKNILGHIKQLLTFFASLCLDTTDTGSNTALRYNLKESYLTCGLCVDTTTELT